MKCLLLTLVLISSAYAKIPDWQEFGINTHGQMGEPIDTIKDMGATWVRAEVPWHYIEVSPNQYDFAYTDILMRDLKQRGMKILFILAYAPSFHSSNGDTNGIPDVEAWKRFVDVITKRYRDYVDVWEVWNEPNLQQFFIGDVRQYFDIILKPAYPIIKRNAPDAPVAAPGLANLYSTKPYEWMKKFSSYGAGRYFDILSHHLYAGNAGGMKKMMTETRIGKPSVLKMVQNARFTDKPFWLTEYGCDAKAVGGDFNQARCLLEQTRYLGTLSWVKNMFVYSLNDDPRYLDLFRWGVLDHNNRPKQAVTQLKSYLRY